VILKFLEKFYAGGSPHPPSNIVSNSFKEKMRNNELNWGKGIPEGSKQQVSNNSNFARKYMG